MCLLGPLPQTDGVPVTVKSLAKLSHRAGATGFHNTRLEGSNFRSFCIFRCHLPRVQSLHASHFANPGPCTACSCEGPPGAGDIQSQAPGASGLKRLSFWLPPTAVARSSSSDACPERSRDGSRLARLCDALRLCGSALSGPSSPTGATLEAP